MTDFLLPADEAELAGIVADAAARKAPLAVAGGGTKAGLGRPTQTAATVSTAAIAGITLYEPAELVIAARAGTLLSEVEAALARNGQCLAFEPADWRRLYGATGAPTVGGVAAANLSGPRRIQAGAARDGMIGLRAVTGAGEVVKSGGRVMKNVTGLDLVKFLAGSYGTLAVLSEVTFKVQPSAETEATLALAGLDDARAVAALSAALGSPWSVTGAAHLPAFNGNVARTLVRLEGFADSVKARAEKLARLLGPYGGAEIVPAEASWALWRAIRDLDVLDGAAVAATPLWRVSVRPSDGPKVAAAVRRAFDAPILYDWGGGLVWIAGGTGDDAGAAVVRAAVAEVGGHATLMRAPDHVRLAVDVAGILNPGRMYAGV